MPLGLTRIQGLPFLSFPWPHPGMCLSSSQPSSCKVLGTICLNLEAPKKIPLLLSLVAACEGTGRCWPPRGVFPQGPGDLGKKDP